MSNRKYPRLSDGYHEGSPYHPYQTKKQSNCIADRDRSPSRSNSKDSSPYFSSKHSNLSPRSQRSKYSYSRSKDISKKGSSQSPNDSHHDSNSHSSERRNKYNHFIASEEFPWSQHTSSSGKVYYYNFKTEKSQWEKPKEWIERERREKEVKERLRSSVSSKDIKDKDDSSYEKSRAYVSKHTVKDTKQFDKRDNRGTDDRLRENHKITELDKGYPIVKTVSANTSAQSTASQRSTPVVAGNSIVSPAGSLQDVSPPSTPSSRASVFETNSHTSSPQIVSVSPLSTPYQNSQSPLGLSRHGALLQVSSSSVSQLQYTKPSPSVSQLHYNSAQYGLVNNGNTANIMAPNQLRTAFESDSNSRPALHPLQQATLLHQRQLSESRNHGLSSYSQRFHTITQTTSQPAAPLLLKENNRINPSPSGSPIIMSSNIATSSPNTKEQFQTIPSHISTTAVMSNTEQLLPTTVSPLPVHQAPVVNLQALAKYVDKSLTVHTTNWPTENIEKQVQRLNDDGSSSASEASNIQIQELHYQTQLDLLDMTINIGSKRISSMKEVTKTLEKLLAESDKKSLT